MCGIVGLAALNDLGVSYKDREALRDMIVADSLRGSEGTGVMVMNARQEVRVMKQAGDPYTLFRNKGWRDFFDPPYHQSTPKDLMVVGHNRWASVGAINTKNAHPHQAGRITLVHNGTLQLHSRLPGMRQCDVDSEALARGIDEMGIDQAIAGTYGAYAIIYFNSEDGTVNLLRNEERPLCFAVDSEQSKILFASEPLMLKWIASRRGIKIGALQMLKPHMHMSFKVTNNPKEQGEPTFRRIEGPKAYFHHRSGEFGDMLATEFDDVIPRQRPPHENTSNVYPIGQSKKEKRKTTRILKSLAKMGIEGQEVNFIGDRTVGDRISFAVETYTTHGKPEDERFMITGKNPLFAQAEIKFYVTGVDTVEKLVEKPAQSATIIKIIKFPKASGADPKYLVWVVNPYPRENQESPKSKSKIPELPDMSQVTKLGTSPNGSVIDLETGEVVADAESACGPARDDGTVCALLEPPKSPSKYNPPPSPTAPEALTRARNHQAAQGTRDPATWKFNPSVDTEPHRYKEDIAADSAGHDIYSDPEVVERILH